ncbi:MAG: lysophospholipid acyltransferase family protein [Patescibacteria group bacterium]
MNRILQRDPFKRHNFIKWALLVVLGWVTYGMVNIANRVKIQGTEHIDGLPETNVLFVSNHQTYFLDVVAMNHVLNAAKQRMRNSIANPLYIFFPRLNNYFVAAEETMKMNFIARIGTYLGGILVQRTWRTQGKDIKRNLRFTDVINVGKALSDGWVITFPQGTTRPNAPGRKGTAHIIKRFKPTVVPVVISGFQDAYFRKAFLMKRIGSNVGVRFKKPLYINYSESIESILSCVMQAIEQDGNANKDEKK